MSAIRGENHSNNPFSATGNAKAEVHIYNKHDDTADLRIELLRKNVEDINCAKASCGGNFSDLVRTIFDEIIGTRLGVHRVGST